MADTHLAHLAEWLERAQGVRLAPDRLREPAAAAERLGALAGAADRDLPFEAEPSGLFVVHRRLTRAGGAR